MMIVTKVLNWLKMNGASLLGTAQVIIKGVKEVLTAIVNVISILLPTSTAERIILKIREVVNTIDEVVEKIKVWLLGNIINV